MSFRGTRYFVTLAAGAVLVLGSACGGKSDEEIEAEMAAKRKATADAAMTTAKEIFATRCTPCHGADGKGDGKDSATLDPKPRNFHDADWQKSVTDDHIMKIIREGGKAVGKSDKMPANPDLKDAAVVTALKDHVRGFGKP